MLDQILSGFAVAIEPMNLLFLLIGTVLGTVVGLLPGLGPSAGVALLLPVTYSLGPTTAIIMLAGIYYGSQYGNSISSILINIPGDPSSAMTALDGHPMARKGRAGAALAISAIGSFIGGTIGIILLTLVAAPLASVALAFGPAEYFALAFFALCAVSGLAGKSKGKAMLSVAIGLAIGTIGTDMQTGVQRFTFGVPELLGGISFVTVVIGLFAISEAFFGVERLFAGNFEAIKITGKLWVTRDEWRRSAPPILRGSLLGFAVGVLPGAGATIASALSYVLERRLSKHPEEFGHGAIEGVAGPETANNASTSGAFVPLLSLGIAGSDTTAILLGAFVLWGIQPGPLLMVQHPDLVWGVISSMYFGNVMLLILNLPLVFVFARMLAIPMAVLLPTIVVIAAAGTYPVTNSTFQLYLLLGFGIFGYILKRFSVPLTPLLLALVLGDMMEQSFRQAMTITSGDPAIFVTSPISAVLLLIGLLFLFGPALASRFRGHPSAAATDA